MQADVTQLREYWLERAVAFLNDMLVSHDLPVPDVRVSCGWPVSGGLRARGQVIGQCFSPKVAKDGKAHIFISPLIAESVEVLGTLLHEMLHASVGVQHGHRKPFSQPARLVGLDGPPTATVVSDALRPVLQHFVDEVGMYPHAPIRPLPKQKVGSRLRLYECSCEKPVKVRVAQDSFSARCLVCGELFVVVETGGNE